MSSSWSDSASEFPDNDPELYCRNRHMAVSAEVDDFDPSYTPPVYEKSEAERESINRMMKGSFLFNKLGKTEHDLVLGAFIRMDVPKDTQIITQDDAGDALYLIESGKFNCYRKDEPHQEAKLVNTMWPGGIVGEISLLYSTPRLSTVIATEDAVLWKLDRKTFSSVVRNSALKKREQFMSHLSSIAFLSSLGKDKLIQLADSLKECTFTHGEGIIEQGSESTDFYIIIEGSAEAVKETGGTKVRVMKYGRYDYFGELALLTDSPRKASVVASSDCVCLSLNAQSFFRIMGPIREMLVERAKLYSDDAV